MFKNCSKSVCPTSSIVNEPNRKKVSVLWHPKSEKNTGSSFSNQGTNLWLKNGGVLPIVSVDPFSKGIPTSSKHGKQSIQTEKSCSAPKQRIKPQGERHLSEMIPSTKKECHTQASLRSMYSKQDEEYKRDEPFVVNKENYTNIIVSHFNEQSNADVYNPDEFSEAKNKASAPSSSSQKGHCKHQHPQKKLIIARKPKLKCFSPIEKN